ncbi:DUF333 domain-containing protein [Myxococcota bacterium]|nr:DUF333 domain-containing protein [Myxococcota bacterium]MBU1430797.1 DUF333 domain-containing protein [Myxococcota bacterium]MBU1900119.1 DUF333 domain-containing protein [Myxococcota bacterium]
MRDRMIWGLHPAFIIAASLLIGGNAGAIPNPASQTCIALGGRQINMDKGGFGGDTYGLCRLKDDALVGNWTLSRALRSADPLAFKALNAFLNSALPRPTFDGDLAAKAAQYCEALGGSPLKVVEHLRPSVAYTLCVFEDKSIIEGWTLANGTAYYPDLKAHIEAAIAKAKAAQTAPLVQP